jgi:uncharacterized protein YidB (DUF937 family)
MSILGAFDSVPGSIPTKAGRLLPALLDQMRAYPGGMAGFIAALRQGGLGDVVSSWLGTGPNRAVSSEQLRQAMEPGMLQAITRQSGEEDEGVLQSLTTLLPLVIDKLSPDGTLRDEEVDTNELSGMLSKVMGRFL